MLTKFMFRNAFIALFVLFVLTACSRQPDETVLTEGDSPAIQAENTSTVQPTNAPAAESNETLAQNVLDSSDEGVATVVPTEPAPTPTPASPENHPPKIVQFSASSGTLCPTCETTLSVESVDPDDDPMTFTWQAESGELLAEGTIATYTPPADFNEGGADTVTVTADDGELSTSSSITLIVITETQANTWIQTNGPSGGIINTIEMDPTNPEILYAAGAGGTVFKTENGGENWQTLPAIVSAENHISDILIDPTDPLTIYAKTDLIYKSTDGGQSWRVLEQFGGVTAIAMNPFEPQQLLAGTWDGNAFLSTNGGESWRNVSNNLPNDRIQDIDFGETGEFWVGTWHQNVGYLYHSIDGGTSWQEVNLNQRDGTYIHSIHVDNENPATVYVGLGDFYNEVFDSQNENYLFVTKNSGQAWSSLHLPGTDAMINVIGKPSGSQTLFVGTGGTIYKSVDDGMTWNQLNFKGRNGDMYDLAVAPTNNDVIYVPRRGPGIVKSTDGGDNWKQIDDGILNVSISLLSVPEGLSSGDVYATAVSGEGTFRTTDYGYSWENVTNGGITHPWGDEIRVNPLNPQDVWYVADVGEVFQTTNGGDSWRKIIDPYGAGFRFGSTYAVAPAPSDPNILYALKNGFGIFKSMDGGESWEFLHQSEIDYTYSIAVHPENPDIVYSGYNAKPFQDFAMVRQTTDGGYSWDTALNVPGADAITSVVIDPHNPETVYAGSTGESGQVWVSDDAGVSWNNLNEQLTFTNIHVMTADPNNPEVAYAGVWGGGTYKTEDYGRSWNRLPNDPTISASAIMVAPGNPDLLYLADRTAPRIYRTTDGGATWDTYFDAGEGYYRVLTAVLSPSDPDTVYASIFRSGGPFSGDLFRIQSDGAEIATGTLPRLPVALAIDPTTSETVYAAAHAGDIYKTINGGQEWQLISGSESGLPHTPAIGYNSIVINPHDTQTIYLLGGGDVVSEDLSYTGADPFDMFTVYESKDGGATWRNLNDGNLGENSNSIKGLVVSPNDPNILYVGALNGVFASSDGGQTWANISTGLPYAHTAGVALSSDGSHLYAPTLGGGVFAGQPNGATIVNWDSVSNLTVPIFHVQVAVDPTSSDTIYASAYPGGIFKSIDRGQTWTEANFGLPNFKIDDPTREGYYALAIAPSAPDVLYLGIYDFGLFKSQDGGGTWRPINGHDQIMRGQGILSLLVDPNQSEVVTVSTADGVFRTTNGGEDWQAADNGLGTAAIRVLALGGNGRFYAGSRGEELYQSRDGINWRQMNAFGRFGTFWPVWDDRPLYQYTSLLFHPTDPDIIFFGTFPAGIFKSEDGGRTWRESNVGWTNDGVFTLTYHPDDTNIIYAGTYNGINRSTDLGEHWEVWDQGWPDEQWVFSIDFDPRDSNILYACSKNGENEGRGEDGFHGTVMKSVDAGLNWFPITNGIDIEQEFYKIIVDRLNPDILYLATQWDGIYISQNAGESWLPWNDGLTNPIAGTNGNNVTNTMMLSPDGLHLYFGTAGSGVYRRMTVGGIEHCNCLEP